MNIDQLIARKIIVGYVNVTKPVEYTERGFQTAAWWEKTISETGVFPVYIGKRDEQEEPYFYAQIPATVVEDYFPSSFAGASVQSYDTKQNAGRLASPIGIHKGLAKGICESTASGVPEDGAKWAILPVFYDDILACLRVRLDSEVNWLERLIAQHRQGQHDSANSFRFSGKRLEHAGKSVADVALHMKFVAKPTTDYFKLNNTFLPPEVLTHAVAA